MHYINNKLIQPYLEALFGRYGYPEHLCPEHMKIYDINDCPAPEIKITASPYPVLVISYSLRDNIPNNLKFTYIGSLSKSITLCLNDFDCCFIAVLDDNMTFSETEDYSSVNLSEKNPPHSGRTACCDIYPAMLRDRVIQKIPSDDSQEALFIRKLSAESSSDRRAGCFNDYLYKSRCILRCPQSIKNLKTVILRSKGNISVSEMASYAGFSERSVNRSFTKYYGFGPKDYCKYIRFQCALNEIFKNPMRQNSEFIQNIGYSDQAHFQREFKSFMGMTPKQFTRLINEANAKS